MLDLLKKYNGFIFDIIQFSLGTFVFYFLGLRLTANIDFIEGGTLSAGGDILTLVVLIIIIIAQPVGAYFLKDSVQNYYTDSNRKEMGSPGFFFMIMIAVLHLVFFGMLVLDVLKNMGFDYIRAYDEYSGFVGFLLGLFLFICASLPTVLTCIIIFPAKKEFVTSQYTWIKTLIGDFIISFSAFAFISIYWDNLIAPLAEDLSKETTGFKIFVLISFFLLFLMIYLPPRLIFMISDYNRLFTWVRIIVVYFPFLLAVLS